MWCGCKVVGDDEVVAEGKDDDAVGEGGKVGVVSDEDEGGGR